MVFFEPECETTVFIIEEILQIDVRCIVGTPDQWLLTQSDHQIRQSEHNDIKLVSSSLTICEYILIQSLRQGYDKVLLFLCP